MKRCLALPLFALFLAACNLPTNTPAPAPTIDTGLVGTIAAQTLEAMHTPTLPVTITSTATATLTPTLTATFAPPEITFGGSTNCRQGPGTEYDVITVISAGQKTAIVGVPPKGNYWLVKNPNGESSCWVAGDYATITGSVQTLPTVSAPPTPTPQPPPAPAWKTWNYNCTFASGGSTLTIALEWTDRASNEEGYSLYRNDQLAATLAPDTTAYTDTTFVGVGQSVSYVIEVFNKSGKARSSVVQVACQ